MNNFRSRRALVVAAVGGLIGFFLVMGAIITVLVVGFMRGAHVFGGGIQSLKDTLITAIFVPALVSLGAAIPAWVLGVKWWHGLLAGVIAMLVFGYIELNGGKQFTYGMFSPRETFAYISAALVSVLIATVSRNTLHPTKSLFLLVFVIGMVILRIMLSKQIVGFVVSLLVWMILPLGVTFFTLQKQHEGAE
jgi:hypothetical protein